MGISRTLSNKEYCRWLKFIINYMCPACIITIGGGLLIAKKLGVSDILTIGLLTVIFSFIIDIFLRKINRGKLIFNYQRVIIPVILLIILSLAFELVL